MCCILQLGCFSGFNLLYMAWHLGEYPTPQTDTFPTFIFWMVAWLGFEPEIFMFMRFHWLCCISQLGCFSGFYLLYMVWHLGEYPTPQTDISPTFNFFKGCLAGIRTRDIYVYALIRFMHSHRICCILQLGCFSGFYLLYMVWHLGKPPTPQTDIFPTFIFLKVAWLGFEPEIFLRLSDLCAPIDSVVYHS